MRLAAQIKGGYYPAPPDAVAHAATFLRPPNGGRFCFLDPCCGEGAALQQIAEILNAAADNVYGIELDPERVATTQSLLPDSHILGPASALGVACTRKSFSLAWVNPPFDDQISGGDRVELEFLRQMIDWIVPGGVICFVIPESTSNHWSFRQLFIQWFEEISIEPFPEHCRPYNEVIVFGRRLDRPRSPWSLNWNHELQPPHVYDIPTGRKPTRFIKVELTEAELRDALRVSPLQRHLQPHADSLLVEPPLSLGKGHIALLLASGHLDGIVQPEGEPPHVVRGTAKKTQYVAGVEQSDNADGSVTTKTCLSEKITLTVRAVGVDGRIKTFEGG